MRNTIRTVLISGASIAGPALAYWLGRYGFQPTVVELAPGPRTGGYAVDFRGPANHTVLTRMGILDELRELQTGGYPMRFVDERGRQVLHLPATFAGGDVEVLRSDLSRVLREHSAPTTEYLFGDTITGLHQTPDGIEVTFQRAAPRTFDLVIGADGLHSAVRALAFGPERRFVSYLDYYIARWDVPNHLGVGHESISLNIPGRMVGITGDRHDPSQACAFVVFASPELDYDRHDESQQKKLVADAFTGVGWEVPTLLAGLRDADSLFFDSISRVDIDPWHTGRVGLVGDAACGATLGGMGTGTAIIGAYVLAGELARCEGDHAAAFARYDEVVRGLAQRCQRGGDRAGKFLAPRGRTALWLRNRTLSNRFLLNLMLKAGENQASYIDLPDYPC